MRTNARLKITRNALLRDALYNLAPRSGASDEYRMGVLVGVISTLMATGASFEQSISLVRDTLREIGITLTANMVPESWRADLGVK